MARLFAVLFFSVISVRTVAAQLVHGTVAAADSRAPVAGVLITIRDSTNVVRARLLTDATGRFAWHGSPGGYRISAEHIGYQPANRSVSAGSAAPIQFALRPAPIALDAVVAHGSARCRTTNDAQAAKVWYFARTALGAAAAPTNKRFRLRTFTRYLDLNLKEVEPEKNDFQLQTGRHAFRAVSLDSLLRFGFVQDRGPDRYFFGPDAELLLADDFVNAYCFRVVRDPERAGFVGLSYWPQAGNKVKGIKGTLWVNERTGMLQFVEYSFTDLGDIDTRFANGRVDFDRLPDHTWFVRNWYIRMPRHANVATGGTLRMSLIGAEEGGGEVLGIDSTSTTGRVGQVQGMIYDSIAGRPLTRAHVYLSGTQYSGETDAQGRFTLTGVREGTHYISFFHPAMRELATFPNLMRIDVSADSVTNVVRAIPSESTLVDVYCPREKMVEAAARLAHPVQRLAVFTGNVRSARAPLAGARVHIKWDTRTLSNRAINKGVTGAWSEADQKGDYVICGIPIELDLALEVSVEGRLEHRALMRGAALRAARKEIIVD